MRLALLVVASLAAACLAPRSRESVSADVQLPDAGGVSDAGGPAAGSGADGGPAVDADAGPVFDAGSPTSGCAGAMPPLDSNGMPYGSYQWTVDAGTCGRVAAVFQSVALQVGEGSVVGVPDWNGPARQTVTLAQVPARLEDAGDAFAATWTPHNTSLYSPYDLAYGRWDAAGVASSNVRIADASLYGSWQLSIASDGFAVVSQHHYAMACEHVCESLSLRLFDQDGRRAGVVSLAQGDGLPFLVPVATRNATLALLSTDTAVTAEWVERSGGIGGAFSVATRSRADEVVGRELADGSVVVGVGGRWVGVVRAGSSTLGPVPPWLGSTDDFAVVRNGRTYATVPRGGKTVSVFDAAGDFCGSFSLAGAAVSVSRSGTVISRESDTSCALQYWPMLFRDFP